MRAVFLPAVLITLVSACSTQEKPIKSQDFKRLSELSTPAPIAEPQEFYHKYHGLSVEDEFYWLHDQSYPLIDDQGVLDYLKAENTYFNEFIAKHSQLKDTIIKEFEGRISADTPSLPFVEGGFEYWRQYGSDGNYYNYYRKDLESGETSIFLNVQELAKGFDFFNVSMVKVSPNQKLVAYAVDTNGSEEFTIYVRDIASGKTVGEPIEKVAASVEFSADSSAMVISPFHEDRWDVKSVDYHIIGTPRSTDVVLMKQPSLSDSIYISRSNSGDWLFIYTGRPDQNSVYAVPSDNFLAEPIKLVGAEQGFAVQADHKGDSFWFLSDDKHANFRLSKAKIESAGYENWETVIAGDDTTYIKDFIPFEDFMVVEMSVDGQPLIQVRPNKAEPYKIDFPEESFGASLTNNRDYTADFIRIRYESMVTPDTIYDFDTQSKSLIEKQVVTIPSGYNKNDYVSKRIMAPARDGKSIPISIVYKKGFEQDGSAPMLLEAYGAYGYTFEPEFNRFRLSLLDRGFSYAIAHVRGGDEKGRTWYLDGTMKNRKNAFNDFVDSAQYLVDQNYTAKGNISIFGESSGGTMMGAATVLAPDMWRSVLLGTPFVDVLATMLDDSLPLTPGEWFEWGNPIKDKEMFEYILSYSPYNNIQKREYPPTLVTGGLNDPRVTYWEPAKWTARMRQRKTDNNLLLMRMDMNAGHFSSAGRKGLIHDRAEQYTFVLTAHGISE